jgi:hypothetical protein
MVVAVMVVGMDDDWEKKLRQCLDSGELDKPDYEDMRRLMRDYLQSPDVEGQPFDWYLEFRNSGEMLPLFQRCGI